MARRWTSSRSILRASRCTSAARRSTTCRTSVTPGAEIVFDTLRRHLRWRGYEVLFVRNITDVDDKIIAKANELGVDPMLVAERYTRAYDDAMRALGILPPDVAPRATGHIIEMHGAHRALGRRAATPIPVRATCTSPSRSSPATGSSRDAASTSSRPRARSSPRRASTTRSTSRCGRRPSRASRRGRRPGGRDVPAGTSSARRWRRATSASRFDIHGGGADLDLPAPRERDRAVRGRWTARPSRATGCTTGTSRSAARRCRSR